MKKIAYWIWLSRLWRSGRTVNRLLEELGSPEAIFRASEKTLDAMDWLKPEEREKLSSRDLSETERIRADCEAKGIRILAYPDPLYPAPLRVIPDPPLVLYALGRIPDFASILPIAVVGTRGASFYGRNIAENLGNRLAAAGAYVITGMAAGIDAAASRGAMAAGRESAVVLGTAIDSPYPFSSRDIYQALRTEGLILSEYAPGDPGHPSNFPERNRIISGLSRGVTVVEAPKRSGALITARTALEQGKDVFAVPVYIDVPSFEGSNRLIADGEAKAILNVGDILGEYEWQYEKMIPVEEAEKSLHEKSAGPAPSLPEISAGDGADAEEKILRALGNGGLSAEELQEKTGIAAADLQTGLTLLELLGRLKNDGGRYFPVK
ncbi:MAG: DNA-processing protein DprA [Clostridia bacterium]|nr:DNA-processing protein DprA [Clostridia bacterium]